MRTAQSILAVIGVGAVLYWLRDIFTPLALALFMAVLIDGLARLIRKHVPTVTKRAATPVAIIISILLFLVAAMFVADNAASFAVQLVDYTPKLNSLIAQVAARFGMEVTPTLSSLLGQVNATAFVRDLAGRLQGFAS
ncbi:MAG: AI-2E family transporter, partial [Phenylobacterium sp.]